MIVIAEGDIGKNWLSPQQEMIPLGTDQNNNVGGRYISTMTLMEVTGG